MANGGSLAAGQFAVVGEDGPELFTAPSAGSIIPNNMAGPYIAAMSDWPGGVFAGMGGGSAQTINNHIDARGADAAAIARLEVALRELHRSIKPRAVAAVNATRKRGGVFTQNMTR